VEIETEAELVRSADTTKAAADKLKGSLSATQLRNQSTVTIPQNSSVLMLAVTANRGATAADGANALATAYLAQRNDRAAAEVKAVTDSLSAQVDALNKQIEDNSNKIAGLAAGDVAGPFQFTHVAAHQAWHATVNALFGVEIPSGKLPLSLGMVVNNVGTLA